MTNFGKPKFLDFLEGDEDFPENMDEEEFQDAQESVGEPPNFLQNNWKK